MVYLDLIVRLAGAGLPLPEPVTPCAEVASWQKAFVDDWAWFDRRPTRSYRIRPTLPFELRLYSEAVENPAAAGCGHVIVARAAAYLVRFAFKARAAGEHDVDCRAKTDRDVEATLIAAGVDLEAMKRMRREASAPGGMAGVSDAAHRDLLLAAVPCGEDRPAQAQAAAQRLRILMVADAYDRWVMSGRPDLKLFQRAAIPGEEAFDGTLVGLEEAASLAVTVVRPGGVLARCLGRRVEDRN